MDKRRYRTSAHWRVRDGLAAANATALLESWQPGTSVVALGKGHFGLLDLVLACVGRLGPLPCRLTLASWAVGGREARRLADAVRGGQIVALKLLTDSSIVRRCPAEAALFLSLFGEESIRISEVHAKVAIARNASGVFSILSSANLNQAIRLESYIVLDDPNVADYLEGALADLHGRALRWDASCSAHREHFGSWRADPARSVRGTRRAPVRSPDSFVNDGPLGDDVRRPGVSVV